MSNKRKAASTASTVEEKYQIIQRIESKKATQSEIAKETGIPRSTISRWCSIEKEKIIQAYESNSSASSRKRLRSSKYEDIDESLYEWFKERRSMNFPLNGPLLMSKAEDFATLHNQEFKASNGWFDRWKSRYNITFQKMNGESYGEYYWFFIHFLLNFYVFVNKLCFYLRFKYKYFNMLYKNKTRLIK